MLYFAMGLDCFNGRGMPRGYGRGSDVSQMEWRAFFERLEKTRAVLLECVEVMPVDPTPWAYLIMVSTWHSDTHQNRAYYFDQAIQRDPQY